jgi:hypothetical protein
MARRKDKPKASPSVRQLVSPSSSSRQELFHRILLGVVTALVVARPLVATEDPGLRSALPDASGLVLTWLWLVVALGWAVWRFWTRQGGLRVDLIECAMLAVVGLMVLSSWQQARYTFTAWLETWEWVSFLLVFFLVRRLASSPGATQGLLSALLATAVMLSVYAGYQYFVEMSSLAESREELKEQMAKQGVFRADDDPYWDQLEERFQSRNVYATFAHPNSFAGYIGLLLPAIMGWTIAGWRLEGWTWRTAALTACVVPVGAAMWWTHSRGAILAAVLVGAAVVLLYARQLITLRRLRAAAGLLVLLVAFALLAYLGTRETSLGKVAPSASLGLRLGYWKATWSMIREHPWLGVGPGNFGRHYPQHMTETDYEEVQDPHNFTLELWASCGVFGMIALLLALGMFCRYARSFVLRPLSVVHASGLADQGLETKDQGPRTPWEFYLGGMAGLILGFLLNAWYLNADERLLSGVLSGARSLIWFPAFALFQSIRWTGPPRTVSLAAGIALLLLNLCVSGGISIPAVAQPLWLLAALALPPGVASRYRKAKVGEPERPSYLSLLLPVPILAVLALLYWSLFLQPVAKGARLARLSLKAGEDMRVLTNPELARSMPKDRVSEIRRTPVRYLNESVLRPLQIAAEANPGDVRYQRWLADWTGVLWQFTHNDQHRNAARAYALKCQDVDPLGREGLLAEARLEAMFGAYYQLRAWQPILAITTPWGPFPQILPIQPLGCLVTLSRDPMRSAEMEIAQKEFGQAAAALEKVVKLGRTQTYSHFQYLAGLQAAGRTHDAEREANELLRLDRKATHRSRQLTDAQREQIHRWLQSRQQK